MFIDLKDFRVPRTAERAAVRRFKEELDELIEEQPGCLGVESWGTGDHLYVASSWQDRRQADAAIRTITPYVRSGACGCRPLSRTIQDTTGGDQTSAASLVTDWDRPPDDGPHAAG